MVCSNRPLASDVNVIQIQEEEEEKTKQYHHCAILVYLVYTLKHSPRGQEGYFLASNLCKKKK